MQAAKRIFGKHVSRQQETLAVVLLALLTVLAYAIWGASILRAEKQAQLTGPDLASSVSQDRL